MNLGQGNTSRDEDDLFLNLDEDPPLDLGQGVQLPDWHPDQKPQIPEDIPFAHPAIVCPALLKWGEECRHRQQKRRRDAKRREQG